MNSTILKYVSVGIGGMAGSSLRYALGVWIKDNTVLFPWETFTATITGAFMLSFLLFLPLTKEKIPPTILPGITTGILGAYTTFSALVLEIVQLFDGHSYLAITYLLLSFFGGLVSSFSGYKLARSRLLSETGGTNS